MSASSSDTESDRGSDAEENDTKFWHEGIMRQVEQLLQVQIDKIRADHALEMDEIRAKVTQLEAQLERLNKSNTTSDCAVSEMEAKMAKMEAKMNQMKSSEDNPNISTDADSGLDVVVISPKVRDMLAKHKKVEIDRLVNCSQSYCSKGEGGMSWSYLHEWIREVKEANTFRVTPEEWSSLLTRPAGPIKKLLPQKIHDFINVITAGAEEGTSGSGKVERSEEASTSRASERDAKLKEVMDADDGPEN